MESEINLEDDVLTTGLLNSVVKLPIAMQNSPGPAAVLMTETETHPQLEPTQGSLSTQSKSSTQAENSVVTWLDLRGTVMHTSSPICASPAQNPEPPIEDSHALPNAELISDSAPLPSVHSPFRDETPRILPITLVSSHTDPPKLPCQGHHESDTHEQRAANESGIRQKMFNTPSSFYAAPERPLELKRCRSEETEDSNRPRPLKRRCTLACTLLYERHTHPINTSVSQGEPTEMTHHTRALSPGTSGFAAQTRISSQGSENLPQVEESTTSAQCNENSGNEGDNNYSSSPVGGPSTSPTVALSSSQTRCDATPDRQPQKIFSSSPLPSSDRENTPMFSTPAIQANGSLNEGHSRAETPLVPPNIVTPRLKTPATKARSLHALSSPFKSPVMKVKKKPIQRDTCSSPIPIPKPMTTPEVTLPSVSFSFPAVKLSFKSPFARKSGESTERKITNLNVRALEAQVQTLHRAIKILEKNEDEELELLGKKWVSVGRDVAWELWKVLKEQTSGSWGNDDEYLSTSKSKPKASSSANWGYSDESKQDVRASNDGWGWAQMNSDTGKSSGDSLWTTGTHVVPENDHSPAVEHEDDTEGSDHDNSKFNEQEDSVGTMLRQLGIASETLGWDDAEGEFVED
ncbi:hypothetical protein SISNIDRAFT_462584 [Sistotremastrum niveocremeum HHB9708]|uniref:Uncharacterized protein n=1 Tax=Sistotremastrum niveocremeum HHB9708 TaxID=1314777 RepID=A0A164Z3X9_9AGAM|nr:hypothetical protein SISNIDRAFT_462584 [Sistotremastrum niveocremeum HHB9708]